MLIEQDLFFRSVSFDRSLSPSERVAGMALKREQLPGASSSNITDALQAIKEANPLSGSIRKIIDPEQPSLFYRAATEPVPEIVMQPEIQAISSTEIVALNSEITETVIEEQTFPIPKKTLRRLFRAGSSNLAARVAADSGTASHESRDMYKLALEMYHRAQANPEKLRRFELDYGEQASQIKAEYAAITEAHETLVEASAKLESSRIVLSTFHDAAKERFKLLPEMPTVDYRNEQQAQIAKHVTGMLDYYEALKKGPEAVVAFENQWGDEGTIVRQDVTAKRQQIEEAQQEILDASVSWTEKDFLKVAHKSYEMVRKLPKEFQQEMTNRMQLKQESRLETLKRRGQVWGPTAAKTAAGVGLTIGASFVDDLAAIPFGTLAANANLAHTLPEMQLGDFPSIAKQGYETMAQYSQSLQILRNLPINDETSLRTILLAGAAVWTEKEWYQSVYKNSIAQWKLAEEKGYSSNVLTTLANKNKDKVLDTVPNILIAGMRKGTEVKASLGLADKREEFESNVPDIDRELRTKLEAFMAASTYGGRQVATAVPYYVGYLYTFISQNNENLPDLWTYDQVFQFTIAVNLFLKYIWEDQQANIANWLVEVDNDDDKTLPTHIKEKAQKIGANTLTSLREKTVGKDNPVRKLPIQGTVFSKISPAIAQTPVPPQEEFLNN